MSNYKNTSIRIKGVGNHVGDKINVKNTHVTNNMYPEAPSDAGKGGRRPPGGSILCTGRCLGVLPPF
jgi:hypothetical protein